MNKNRALNNQLVSTPSNSLVAKLKIAAPDDQIGQPKPPRSALIFYECMTRVIKIHQNIPEVNHG